jgi:hypothetical protein
LEAREPSPPSPPRGSLTASGVHPRPLR